MSAQTTGELEVMKDPITWQHAAQQIGEYLADTGPDGYYAMRADEWLSWARARMSEKLTAIAQRDAAVRERHEAVESENELQSRLADAFDENAELRAHLAAAASMIALASHSIEAMRAARTPTPPQEATNDDA